MRPMGLISWEFNYLLLWKWGEITHQLPENSENTSTRVMSPITVRKQEVVQGQPDSKEYFIDEIKPGDL